MPEHARWYTPAHIAHEVLAIKSIGPRQLAHWTFWLYISVSESLSAPAVEVFVLEFLLLTLDFWFFLPVAPASGQSLVLAAALLLVSRTLVGNWNSSQSRHKNRSPCVNRTVLSLRLHRSLGRPSHHGMIIGCQKLTHLVRSNVNNSCHAHREQCRMWLRKVTYR